MSNNWDIAVLLEWLERSSEQRAIVFQICLLRNSEEASREQIVSWRAPLGGGNPLDTGLPYKMVTESSQNTHRMVTE